MGNASEDVLYSEYTKLGIEHVFITCSKENLGETDLYFRLNMYNPIYNLQTMMPRRETDTLRPRGNMSNEKDERSKANQGAVSTGDQGELLRNPRQRSSR